MARILVIDDTKNIRKMVGLTLEKEGHAVQAAEDGVQGLELFGDGTAWDLTLIDQQMPGFQGSEVIVEARRRNPMARLVMMTAFATNELASQVLMSGAMDFLRKPFSTDVLRGAVTVALSHPRQEVETSTMEAAALPEPGQPGFTMPRSSWRANGFSFWPMPAPESPPLGFDIGRLFQVRKPDGELSRCFVGVTPHIREQAQSEAGRELANDDPFWEQMCGRALLSFIWEKAETPPDVLPVFDAPKNSRGGYSPVPWGPFGGR
jgi:CheY-like chemotaxis protein